jgi:hypothetical protein
MAERKWDMWKEKNAGDPVRPWDMLNTKIERVPDEIAKSRYDICLSCDRLFQSTKQCKECGCFMNAKTKLPHASCPIGKWGSYNANNEE